MPLPALVVRHKLRTMQDRIWPLSEGSLSSLNSFLVWTWQWTLWLVLGSLPMPLTDAAPPWLGHHDRQASGSHPRADTPEMSGLCARLDTVAYAPRNYERLETVPRVVLFRETITKGPLQLRGGYKLPLRSMRASWAGVVVRVDGGEGYHLKQTRPCPVSLQRGHHQFHASGSGFASANAGVDLDDDTDVIIAITPRYRDGVDHSTPLGRLEVRRIRGPQNLQPYKFYDGLPTSIGRATVVPSVLLSILASSLFVGLGMGIIAYAIRAFQEHAVFTGGFLVACAVLITPIVIPAGLGGILIGLRFLRLPPGWRAPEKTLRSS
jgi:hypothetical protein